MTVRSAVAIGSLSLALAVSAACVSFYDISIETPINAKLDTTPFQRVLVLGFVSGGTKDVDVNSETVRLLRSQLRTKSNLKVIDSDVVSLIDVVDKLKANTGTPAVAADAPASKVETNVDAKTDAKMATTPASRSRRCGWPIIIMNANDSQTAAPASGTAPQRT